MQNISNANKVVAINDCLYHYFIYPTSTSRGGKLTEKKMEQWINSIIVICEQFTKLNLRKEVKEDILSTLKDYIYYLQYMAYIKRYDDSYKKLTLMLSNLEIKSSKSRFNDIISKEMEIKMPILVVHISHRIFYSLNLL